MSDWVVSPEIQRILRIFYLLRSYNDWSPAKGQVSAANWPEICPVVQTAEAFREQERTVS